MKKFYTEEQKYTILQRYWSGEPVGRISADTEVAKSTIYKWIREAPPKKANPVNMTDFRILKQRCETLEKMVEILQMSPCTVSAPLHDRYEVIKDLSDTYSISLLCKALMVAKSRRALSKQLPFRARIQRTCRGIHRILQQQAPSSDQPLSNSRCDGGILLQASYKQWRRNLIELLWSVLLGFFKSRTNFGGFLKSQFD